MRLSRRERLTAAASFAVCCALVLSAGLPAWLQGTPGPTAAPPQAASAAVPPPGGVQASTMPVAARRIPPSQAAASWPDPVLAGYARETAAPSGTDRPFPGAAPSSQPASRPAPAGTPAAAASTPPPFAVSLDVPGIGGCLGLGGSPCRD